MFNKATEKSRYKQITQKYHQHMQNFAEDPNTRIRWIWQLIQNAKDVPNQFGKVKISIEINDNELKFSHNGDPFRMEDLQSLMYQYSQKTQMDPQQETTGNYGTGFITTYILSKKLKIQGILKVFQEIEENQLDSSQDQKKQEKQSKQETQEISFQGQSQIKKQQGNNSSFISQIVHNFDDISKKITELSTKEECCNQIELEINEEQQKGEENKNKNCYYQKFEMKLDRQNPENEKEFIKKLQKEEKKIKNYLEQIQKTKIKQRNQDSFDTVFTYRKLDQTSFKIIEEGLNTLKSMFPYALLFNKKLYEIRVSDKRTQPSIQNFTIRKESNQKKGVLNISVCSIISEKVEKIRNIFKIEKQTNSIIAIPIEIIDNRVKLLTIQSDFPKVFKQFPLIGAQDSGYNYVFTSNKFKPNQTRSNLLLKKIPGRESKRVQQNWYILQKIFRAAESLFNILPNYINESYANFFHIKDCLFLGNSETFFTEEKEKIKQKISSYKIIKTVQNKMVTIQDITYFMDLSDKDRDDQTMSNSMNQLFSFLIPQHQRISNEIHKQLFSHLKKSQWSNSDFIYFMNFKDCLNQIAQMGYQKLVQNLNSDEKVFDLIRKIYQLMKQYAPQYLDYQSEDELKQVKIFLTNNYQFEQLSKLNIKHEVTNAYEQIANYLGIGSKIQSRLIHDDVAQLFKNMPKFTFRNFEKQFHFFFEIENSRNKIMPQRLKLLIQYCRTMKIHQQITDIAIKIKFFQDAVPFNVVPTKLQDLQKQIIVKYRQRLRYCILAYVQQSWFAQSANSKITTLKDLLNKLNLSKSNTNIGALQWFNNLLNLQKQSGQSKSLQIINKNISWDNHFILNYDLNRMIQYPDQFDIQIYEEVRTKWNEQYIYNKKQSLMRLLLHPSIKYHNSRKIVTFSQLFNFISSFYTNSKCSKKLKIRILQFIDKLVKENKQKQSNASLDKIKTFEKYKFSRHYQYLQNIQMSQEEVGIVYDMVTIYRKQLPDILQLLNQNDINTIKDIMKEI